MSQPLKRKKAGRAEGGSVWDGAVEGGEGEAGRSLCAITHPCPKCPAENLLPLI